MASVLGYHMQPWLQQFELAGNSPARIIAFAVTLLVALLGGRILRYVLDAAGRRVSADTRPMMRAALAAFAEAGPSLIGAFGFAIALQWLNLDAGIRGLADAVAQILITLAMAHVAYRLVDVPNAWFTHHARASGNRLDDMLIPVAKRTLQITVIVLAIVQISTILSGKSASSLLAGLGIGGLAIALGAQETLKNFFGSLSILLDKPFALGERIVVDGHDGPVESVGFRSTKIRTLDGHLVAIPNGELANRTIQNIGKRPHIRRLMRIGITYGTPTTKIEEARTILVRLLENHEGIHPDFPPRVHFSEFQESCLEFLVIYWYHPPDYWKFMAFSERLNLDILREFNRAGIEFAFPTRTIHIADGASPLPPPRPFL